MPPSSKMVVLDCSVIVRRNEKSELIAAGTPVDASLIPKRILDEHLVDESKPREHVPMPKDFTGVRYARPDGSTIDDWNEHREAEAKRFEEEERASGLRYYDRQGVHEPDVPQEEVRFYDTRSGQVLEPGSEDPPTEYVETHSRVQREIQRERP
jgi:hypothetical protein